MDESKVPSKSVQAAVFAIMDESKVNAKMKWRCRNANVLILFITQKFNKKTFLALCSLCVYQICDWVICKSTIYWGVWFKKLVFWVVRS